MIIYSLNWQGSLKHSPHWLQLLYSIETIRRHSDVPIKVYLNESALITNPLPPDVELIRFIPTSDSPCPTYQAAYASKLNHRWENTVKTFELFDVDRVLFLDSDTIMNRPPELLLEKYSDKLTFWTRTDIAPSFTQGRVKYPLINDGQFIISREILRQVPNLLETQKRLIAELIKENEDLPEAEWLHLHWIASQYSAAQAFKMAGVKIGLFDHSDVSLSTEPISGHGPSCAGLTSIIHHYFFGNSPRYLPRRCWVEWKSAAFDSAVSGKKICGCGHLSDL